MDTPRIALFGASRGFGRAFAETWIAEKKSSLFLSARKSERLTQVQNFALQKGWMPKSITLCPCDLAREDQVELVIKELEAFAPQCILYFPAGGPYGPYAKYQWKDHQWSLQVSFLTPARLLHWALGFSKKSPLQFITIGSAIAESQPDPGAASYCASKHALWGLVQSLQCELQEGESTFDLRHISPPYMDTELLPQNSWPRQKPDLVQDPFLIAKKVIDWMSEKNMVRKNLSF